MENILFCVSSLKPTKQQCSHLSLATKPDYIVVLAWIHTKNIIINNQDYLNQGGTMVALWPKYEEITSDNYNQWLDEKN